MTGQRLGWVVGAVLLAQEADGNQVGWHVFDVEQMGWEFVGIGPNGSRATVTITGSFHRMNRQETDHALEQQRQIEEGG